jgi:hypothetical protein
MILGGLRVVTVPNWQKVEDGTYTERFPNHLLICWLDRMLPWLGIGSYTESTLPNFRDIDPLVDVRGGAIYCSSAQYVELARAARRQTIQEIFEALRRGDERGAEH